MRFFHFRTFILYAFVIFVIAITTLEFLAYLYLSRDERMSSGKVTLDSYELVLCNFQFAKKKFTRSLPAECPEGPIITTFTNRKLHLSMWRYANMIAGMYVTGMKAYVPTCMKRDLEKVFGNLTLPRLTDIGHCFIPNITHSVSSISDWRDDGSNSLVFTARDLFNEDVLEQMHDIRRHFVFKPVLANVAKVSLSQASKELRDPVFVGAYIKRSSVTLEKEYSSVYPSVKFVKDAMAYFRKKFENTVFMLITDNAVFWKRKIKSPDVTIILENDFILAGSVLAILSHCNHSILAFGDIAIWGAIFANGEAVVSPLILEEYSTLLQYYINWTFLPGDTRFQTFRNPTEESPEFKLTEDDLEILK